MHRFLSILLLAVHGFLILQFYLIWSEVYVEQEWVVQFFLLWTAQFATVLVQVFSKKKKFRISALVFSCILVAIIAVPFRKSIGIGLTLFLIMVLEGALHRKTSILLVPPVFFALTLLVIPKPLTAWDMQITDSTLEAIVTVLVMGIAMVGLILKLVLVDHQNSAYSDRLRRMKNAVEELSAANLGYSTFARFAHHQATVEERNRITREIHDGIGYTLTNIMMLSEASLDKTKSDQASLRENLNAVRVQAKTGLYDTRRALRLLRAQEDALPRGLDAIRQMIEIYTKATGTEVNLQINVSQKTIEHSAIFLTIYRFVQEALTNSFRHGHATKVDALFYTTGQWIIIIIRDNGVGVNAMKEGIGLQGMRERIEFVGGELEYFYGGEQESGFTVIAHVPIQGNTDEN